MLNKLALFLGLTLFIFLSSYGLAATINVQNVDFIGAGEAEIKAANIEVCDVKWYVYPYDISYTHKMDLTLRSTDVYSHDIFLHVMVLDDLDNVLYEKSLYCTLDGGFGTTHTYTFYRSPENPGLPINRVYEIVITAIEKV